MRVYVDSSALMKRAVAEAESDALESTLQGHVERDDVLLSLEPGVDRGEPGLRGHLEPEGQETVATAVEDAMSGIAERPIGPDVVGLARRIGPRVLRSLDAIHLATAVLLDVDAVVTYDDRLAAAARLVQLPVVSPAAAP